MGAMENLLDAVGKLVKAKGRFHTEQNYKAVVEAYDAARRAPAAAPAPVAASDDLYRVEQTQGITIISKGRRRIAHINGAAFRSPDAEREEAEKIVAALAAPPAPAAAPIVQPVADLSWMEPLYRWMARAQFSRVFDEEMAARFAENIRAALAAPTSSTADAKDAARYRWLRDQGNSLETQQRDTGIDNGPSCYHEVEGIRELKSGDELDEAIDRAAIASSAGEVKP